MDISELSPEEQSELKKDPRKNESWESYDKELQAMLMERYEELNGITVKSPQPTKATATGTEEVIQQLVAARQKAKLTQQQLAARLGMSQPALARLERAGANPSLKNLVKIADALGVSVKIG